MFNLPPFYILSAAPSTIHLHMDENGGYLLRPVPAAPLIWPIIFHWVHLQTAITKPFQWPWQSEVKINRCPFLFFSNPCRSLLFHGRNPALILYLTKDYWFLSSHWQKEMPIKVEEQIYLISSLIIWSIYQPFRAPVLCVTQTYWRIEGYCHLHIKEFHCYCFAQSNSLVLKQYHHYTVIFGRTAHWP